MIKVKKSGILKIQQERANMAWSSERKAQVGKKKQVQKTIMVKRRE